MTTSPPPVASVVIAYYKNAATIGAQLEALASQAEAPLFEVILADNEGSKELPLIVQRYEKDLDVRVVAATQRRGQCHARNTGVDAARSDFVLICDADDIVGQGWVASLHAAIESDDVLATGPLRVDHLNPELVWKTYLSAGSPETIDEASLVRPFTFLGYLPLIIGCNMAIRRSTFNVLGRLDPTMTGGSEDADLAWRAQEAGINIQLVERAIVDYRLRAGVKEIFQQRRRYEHSKMRIWLRSRIMNRPVRGMSFRWALLHSLGLVPLWWKLRSAEYEERYVAAFTSGGIIGNLESQIKMRILRLDT